MNKVHHYHHRRKHHKSPNCTIDTAWLYLIAYINISFHIRNDPVCRSTIAQRRPKKAIRKLSGLRHRISWLKFSMGFFCHPKIFRLSGSDLICMTWSDLSSTFAETGFHFFFILPPTTPRCHQMKQIESGFAWKFDWTIEPKPKRTSGDIMTQNWDYGLRKHDCGQMNNLMRRCERKFQNV